MKSSTTTTFLGVENPYSPFLHLLEKPARYIGGEKFLRKKEWTAQMAKMALCFPEVYEIGMSHLGYKILYNELNNQTDILAERCFAPWGDLEEKMVENGLPLVTLESFRPLSDFDIVGFSLQYEMTYTNILSMLHLGGIPIWQKERGEEDPIVIVGGPCATHPEPIAPFADIVLIGDAESLLVEIVRLVKRGRDQGRLRVDILSECSNREGIYIPSFSDPLSDGYGAIPSAKRHIVQSLKDYPFPIKSPIPHATAIFDKFAVELSRGCTEGCRFCQAGMIYRPVRERDPQEVINTVVKGVQEGGFQEASLTCLSTADYSAVTPLIIDLIDKLKEEKSSLGIASLRAYGLNEKVLDKMAEVKNSSLTFAPEAGTERMRKIISKNITEEDIVTTAKKVFSRGWVKIKLYFMIGLPFETDDDVRGIMETGKKVRDIGRALGVKNPEVTVSVSSFVPKPHTPFQWAEMISLSEIQRKQEILFQLARQYKLNFRRHFSKTSLVEGVFSRGGRELSSVIYEAYKGGARFDGWEERFNFELWQTIFNEHQISIPFYQRKREESEILPWDHIDIGTSKKFLLIEWKKAMKERNSPPCGKPIQELVHFASLEEHQDAYDVQKKKLVCYNCGIKCDLNQMIDERKEFLTSLGALKKEAFISDSENIVIKNILDSREKRGTFTGYKYRLRYSKLGPITFISHLDLQKIIVRIFKRAKIKTLYSEGHNQRSLISFGPALPLGINSIGEYLDIRLGEPIEDFSKAIEMLNEKSEEGIFFKEIVAVDHSVASIQELVTQVSYFLSFPIGSIGSGIEGSSLENHRHAIEEKINHFNSLSSFEINIFSKRMKKEIPWDIKSQIIKMSYTKCDFFSEWEKKIIKTNFPVDFKYGILVTVVADKGVSPRPSDLIKLVNQLGIDCSLALKIESR